ncbi:MAG: hypothetical protein JWR26_3666 [Pedosphaera sp.]|nr:hypothetical protein [Pedosphaera sp.]
MDVVPKRNHLPWFRLICVAVALAALWYIIRRTNLASLAETLRSARIGWLLAAVAVYGLVFIPASWRWHLMLRNTGCAVHPGATARMSLIGHFFYTIFFGVAGGDFAKTALYARWYQLPLPQILASAPLDRLLGLGGLILFIVLSFGLAAVNGAFSQLQPASLRMPPFWMALALAFLALAWIALRRWGKLSAVNIMWSAFKEGGKRLMKSWPATLQGLTCGFLVQLALAASLAFGLQAVSHSPVPWGRLLWTFPVISVASALPFNIAGAGLREGAVLALLGLYGVSAADAVAASLITLFARLFWAAMGGLLLWREQKWQWPQRPVPQTLSIIIFTLDEASRLPDTIHRLGALPEVCEIIIADRGSRDQTRELAAQLGCRFVTDESGQNRPFTCHSTLAKGDAVILMDADIWLPAQAGKAVLNCLRDPRVVAGGFWKTIRTGESPLPRPRLVQTCRNLLNRRAMLDQVMFIRREALTSINGIHIGSMLAGSELFLQLRLLGRLALADATVSAASSRDNAMPAPAPRVI